MSVVLVGGMARLRKYYVDEARRCGIDLTLFDQDGSGLAASIRKVDAVLVLTDKVSSNMTRKVRRLAGKNNIPVFLDQSCGSCTLRECFNCPHEPVPETAN